MFLECPSFQRIWTTVNINLDINHKLPLLDNKNFVNNLCKVIKSVKDKKLILLIFTWWAIWLHRNNIIFGQITFNERKVVQTIITSYTEWEHASKLQPLDEELNCEIKRKFDKGTKKNNKHDRENSKWQPPKAGSFKMNFDGSKDGQGKAGAGYCIRDSKGKLVAAGTFNCGRQSIIIAEALGLREGVKAATELAIEDLEIEGDNISVVKALTKEWSTPWEISCIILDVLEDLRSFKAMTTRHCYREVNMTADFLAKKWNTT